MKIDNITLKSFIMLLYLLVFTISSAAHAADIQVKVDRTQIELNETFTLIFESSEDPDDAPDFSPLEKDFQVLGTNTSSNMSIINGSYSKSKKWNVTLIALRTGTITIPSISFGSDSSAPYKINIKEPKKSTGKQAEAFISELDISTHSAYPQQQIIVTQRLLSSSNINAYEFSSLKTRGVEVTLETLGKIKQYQTKRGNTPYLVLEQSYAIYPQSAGQLTIEPSIASARIAIQGNQGNRSAFDPFRSNSKTVRRSSEKKTITVNAIPALFKGKHWLAAKEVQLIEEFPESTEFKVGEPITRTLLLMADGQNSSQLPEFITKDISNLKQYPDKPLLKNNVNDTGITGVQQMKVAIIPSTAGTYTLPAISIPWWNTQTNKLEHAKIPARTFSVKPATISATNTIKSSQPKTENNLTHDINQPDSISGTSGNTQSNNTSNSALLWKIISLLLGIALIITLFLLWQKTREPKSPGTKPVTDMPSLKQALNKIKTACENNDAQAAKKTLLTWGNILFTESTINSLGDLSSRVDSDLSTKLQSLNAALYRNNDEQWQCHDLYQLCSTFSEQFNTELNQFKKNAATDNLESLYK